MLLLSCATILSTARASVLGPIQINAKRNVTSVWKSAPWGARGHRPAFHRTRRSLGIARNRMVRASGFAWPPASRSSYVGQKGAHPHRDQQITIRRPGFKHPKSRKEPGRTLSATSSGSAIPRAARTCPITLDANVSIWTQNLPALCPFGPCSFSITAPVWSAENSPEQAKRRPANSPRPSRQPLGLVGYMACTPHIVKPFDFIFFATPSFH